MSQLGPKEQAVLNALASEGKEYQNYFFSKAKDLKWFGSLKEQGYFDASQNPPPQESEEKGLFTIPTWPALRYLENVSLECSRPENRTYAEDLLQIIRNVTRPPSGQRTDNYRTWPAFARILSNLPNDLIKESDIDLVGDWLDSKFGSSVLGRDLSKKFLSKLLRSPDQADWEKATKLVETVTQIRVVEKVYGKEHKFMKKEAHTALESYSLKGLFEANALMLGKRAGSKVVTILVGRLKESFTTDSDDDLSYIWRRAIEEHEQNVATDQTKHILVSAIRDVLLGLASEGQDEAKGVLSALLNHELALMHRIAFHTINSNYSTYRELLWEVIGPQWFKSVYQHELYQLLSQNFSNFTPPEQERLIDIVQSLTRDWPEDEDRDLLDKRMRLTWLQAIRGKGSPRADRLYDEYLSVIPYQPKHPDFASYTETRVGNIPPQSREALLSMSIPEIIGYLKDFQETGHWDDPTEEGLADVLMEAVKGRPQRFDEEALSFVNCKLGYQYELLRGFEEAWRAKKVFNWESVLEFCQKVIEPDNFWQLGDRAPDVHLRATRSWITSAICGLISAGVRSDEWAFHESLLPKAEKIILKILEKEPPTAEGRDDDAMTEALNTPKGRCIDALIAYSLRRARLLASRMEDRDQFWQHIQPFFDHELNKCRNGNYEFSALAGSCVLQLHYLSRAWLESNFNRIFSLEYERNWLCAMQGYFYVSLVHPDIYGWLKTNGHLTKVLEQGVPNPDVRKRIIQQIAVQYLEGEEALEGNGPFSLIIHEWKQDDISEIVCLFWQSRKNEVSQRARQRVLDFWKSCAARIQSHEQDNAAILSYLCLLASYLSQVGQEEESWLVQAAPYVDVNHNSSFFIEYLEGLVEEFPKAVAKAYLAMLTKALPTFEEENICSIVGKLYSRGLKEEANHIVNNYAKKGYEFLREVYEKNRSRT